MKITVKVIIIAAVILVGIPMFTGCSHFGKTKGQSTEFATFVKAYTGGIISDKSTIRVELASDVPEVVPGEDIKNGILTFSPSIKGTARWLSSSMIEFIPDQGALKSGQAYTGKLRLDKIRKISNRKFKKFSFSFMVAIKEAVLSLGEINITAASPDKASVDGIISLTEELPLEKVQSMIEYDYPDQAGEMNITPGSGPLEYRFEITDLPRSDKDRRLRVSMKPGDTGFVTDSELDVTIPSVGEFRVVSADMIGDSDPYIMVNFSEPLSDARDFTGMFELSNAESVQWEIENSHVKINFERKDGDEAISLKVYPEIKSYDGSSLGTEFTKAFENIDIAPAVEIYADGNILPNAKELILPFRAVNLNAVDIKVIQIYEDNVLMFLQENDLGSSSGLRRSGRLIYKRCVRLDTDPSKNLHKWQDYSVDLTNLFKQEKGAIFRIVISFKQEYSVYGKKNTFKSGTPSNDLVELASTDLTPEDEEVWDIPETYYYDSDIDWSNYNWNEKDNPLKPSYYMISERFPSINLLMSNLGVIAKYAGGDKIWVSVNDILTANPVFNAELAVYNFQLKEIGYAKTDRDGFAEISLSGRPFVVVAQREMSTSYLKVTEGSENSLSRFDVGGEFLDKGLKGFVYGERGVWRPGDTLHVTLMLQDKENKIPDNHPAVMELYTPEGQFYSKMVNSEGKNGFYVFNIQTNSSDPTGTWNAYFKIGGATFHKSLRIEDIKPNRLKINLDLRESSIDGGETVPVTVAASWLTGPPAAGLNAKVTMTLRNANTSFKGFDGYSFTFPGYRFSSASYDIIDTRLNSEGSAMKNVEMPTGPAPGLLRAEFVTQVEEPGGDVSYSTTTVPYSPYKSYVGIKAPVEDDSHYLQTSKEYTIKIANVDKNGNRVSGNSLNCYLYKTEWSWWWESDTDNLDSYINGRSSEPVSTMVLAPGSSDSEFHIKINDEDRGRYLLLVQDSESSHVAGQVLYFDWPGSVGFSRMSDPSALTMLSFSTDKQSYDVGETVKVYIPNAEGGEALVSLENSRKVIQREWVKTSGSDGVTYSFKVTPEMAPNFYIHITLIQPHERADNDLPIRLYGVQPILVNDRSSHLEPKIDMPETLHPDEEFSIKVSEKNGKAMTYTLAIVDEGLLDLTGFRTPDPWNAMFKKEALGVSTWDLYDYVIGAYSGRFSPMFSIGGDEDVEINGRKDNRFNAIVKFIGPFTLQNGTATHKIKIPTYVGSVRVMLVAGNSNAYGSSEKTVKVTSPLMILPTLPRVLGTNEKVSLPVNVFALEDDVRNARISVRAEGPLKIVGDAGRSVTFEKPGDQLVNFDLETVGTGMATVYINAEGAGHKASDKISIEVRNPNPATISVTRQTIRQGEARHFGFEPFTASEDEWASLEVAGFPAIDIAGIYSYMKNYDFSCTEQLSARGIALISLKKLLPEDKQNEIDTLIPQLLQQLYQRQLGSGGFVYWPGSPDPNSWVTSMAGEFLILASQNGYPVSKGVLSSWSRFQKRSVQDYRSTDKNYLNDLDQAYKLYTLALNGEPESGAMNRLKEDQDISDQAGWMLASAYVLAGKKSVAKEYIARLKSSFTDYSDGDDITFDTPLRDKAIAIEALANMDEIQDAMDLAADLADGMRGWYSTQEAAFASRAMQALASKAQAGDLALEIQQGGKSSKAGGAGAVSNVEVDTKAGGIDIKNTGKGIAYATLILSSHPDAGQKIEAKASGLSLNVAYSSSEGRQLNPASIAQGTDFTVTITVANTSSMRDYANLALTEMIPSGWEIFNDRLFTSGGESTSYDYRDIRDDRVIWFFGLPSGGSKTFTMKLHAAYVGEFVLPAISCEAMYDSRVSANTASGVAKVTEE